MGIMRNEVGLVRLECKIDINPRLRKVSKEAGLHTSGKARQSRQCTVVYTLISTKELTVC
jgi:hypothetical protein